MKILRFDGFVLNERLHNGWNKVVAVMRKYPDVFAQVDTSDDTYRPEKLDFDKLQKETNWDEMYDLYMAATGSYSISGHEKEQAEKYPKWKKFVQKMCAHNRAERDGKYSIDKDLSAVGIQPHNWPTGMDKKELSWFGYDTDGNIKMLPYGKDFGRRKLAARLMPIAGQGSISIARVNRAGNIVKNEWDLDVELMKAHPELFAKIIRVTKNTIEIERLDVSGWETYVKTHPSDAKAKYKKLSDAIHGLRQFVDMDINHNVGLDAEGHLKAFDF